VTHPDFELLVDMSRSGTAHAGAAAHLAGCAECTDTVAWASGVRAAAAVATSFEAPAGAWSQIESRLDLGERLILPRPDATRSRRVRAAAIAAGLVLLASAGAALVPQTGVRAWIERHLLDMTPARTESPVVVPSPDASPSSAGLALQLVDGALHIDFTSAVAPLVVRVRVTDAADVEVSATGSAAGAQFLAGSGRLEIAGAAGGEITLLLPRSARLITIDADGIRALEMRGGRLTVHAEQADTTGAEIILSFR
jgi:hypothetical protein